MRSRAVVDFAVAGAAFACTLVLLLHLGVLFSAGSRSLDPIGVVLVSSSTLSLVAWRRIPLGVFVLTAGAGLLLAVLGYPVGLIPGPAIALYLLTASRGREAPWTVRAGATVVALLLGYLGALAAGRRTFPDFELIHAGMAWAVAWFAGERTRLRREQVAELSERALRAERDVERERLLAVAEERARIARDLHDSAGNAISLIAVRAGAARLRHQHDPARSLLALQAIEDLARRTVDEIDQLVGSLRRDGPGNGEIDAPPGLASLDTLVAHHAAAGLRATVGISGTPSPLGAAADQGAYRILQEALTNAAHHGTGDATVELAFTAAAIELSVCNPVLAEDMSRRGGGHGLIGMRERATLLGGSLEIEQVEDTYRVRARIPYGGHRG